MPALRILHLEDNPLDSELVLRILEDEGLDPELRRVDTRDDFCRELRTANADLIISDFTLPFYNGLVALSAARELRPELPFIFFSGTIGEEAAVESLKTGATDYVLKHRPEKLVPAVRRALREVEDRQSRAQAEEALRKQERWFRTLTENGLDIVSVLDRHGRFKYNSPSIEKVLGFAPGELIGQSAFSLIHPADLPAAQNGFQRALRISEGPMAVQFRFRHKDGSWRNLEVIGQALLDDPAIDGIVLNGRDITQRLEAEQKYRSIFENSMEGICQTTPDGRFTAVNPSLAEMLGYASPDQLIHEVQDIATQVYARADEREAFKGLIAEHGIVKGFVLQARTKQGKTIWISLNARAICDHTGAVRFYDCSIEDITDRKLAQEQIRQQATLLDEAPDAIFVTDPHDIVLYWNRGAEELYGWKRNEILGQKISSFLPQWQPASTQEIMAAFLEKGRWEGEMIQTTRDGKELVVSARRSLLRDENDQPKAVLVINTDLTEKKKTEAQFLRAQRMESLGVLAGGIAHDLNNIFSPILLASELLRDNVTNDEGRKIVEVMCTTAQRGSEMVKQILSFARGAAGQTAALDLHPLVNDICKLLRRTLPPSVRIQNQLSQHRLLVMGNVTQLHQVLMNLCVNARDAMPNGGLLQLEAETALLERKTPPGSAEPISGKFVKIVVRDTGTGIPPELLAKIFDPFFTTKEEGKGTGLGLSTVVSIVKSHSGFLEVDSKPGEGTAFTIFLPAAENAPGREDSASAAPPDGHGKLVLVVDDEEALLEMCKLTLETFNYRVVTARDGVAGLLAFEQHRAQIQVAVVDLMMPLMDGARMIKELRRVAPSLKIICASGASSRAKTSLRETLDANAFLNKPYSTQMLLRTISSLAREPKTL